MPSPKKNTAYTFNLVLVDQAARPSFKTSPTLAAGDFKISIDDGAYANLSTLPAVTPAGSADVKVSLSAAEMNGDRIKIMAKDAAGAEWDDVMIYIETTTNTVDDLATAASVAAISTDVGTISTDVGTLSADVAALSTDVAAISTDLGSVSTDVGTISTDVAAISTDVASISTDVGTANTNIATLTGFVDTEVAAIKAKTDLIPATPLTAADVPTAIQNADALLDRDMSAGTDSGSPTIRTPRQALRFLRNKWSVAGTALTVTKEDDATTSWTATVSTSAGADPISGSDPAGP